MSANLHLEGVEKKYRSLKALDNLNFEAIGGKIVVTVGVNGAGKTTLLRICAGLEKPDKGKILFNNKPIVGKELRQIATLVFQRTAMFSRSVSDNLAFGLKIRKLSSPEIKKRITEALHDVGLKDFEKRRAKKTSGGEMQRIALARAFLLEPKILLLDEPTANLDPHSATIIENAIRKRKSRENIVVLATHNLNQARRLGDEIVHMHGGKIVERAATDEFFETPSNEITRKFLNGELEVLDAYPKRPQAFGQDLDRTRRKTDSRQRWRGNSQGNRDRSIALQGCREAWNVVPLCLELRAENSQGAWRNGCRNS
jgi:tungstate transport system ATP-binding protein